MSRCILHISADYPDAWLPNKTPVIQRLVQDLSASSRNVVISLNRCGDLRQAGWERREDVFSFRYFSPPMGVFQSFFLKHLARSLQSVLAEAGIRPDIIIGHKFTIESCLAWHLSVRLGVPFVAAFMGNTDQKIYRAKPHYRPFFRRVAQAASALIFPTPWCRDYFLSRLAVAKSKSHLIPYISMDSFLPVASTPVSPKHFVAICRLDVWRIKNLHRLLAAMAQLCRTGDGWRLDIIGAGSQAAEAHLRGLIGKHQLEGVVSLLGGMGREQIDALLPRYGAMVLPSFPESFGLVYLEALAQGVPIMTARNSGFDGFFPENFPGVVVPHESVDAIAAGLTRLAEENARFRAVIQAMALDRVGGLFDRELIVGEYKKILGVS